MQNSFYYHEVTKNENKRLINTFTEETKRINQLLKKLSLKQIVSKNLYEVNKNNEVLKFSFSSLKSFHHPMSKLTKYLNTS